MKPGQTLTDLPDVARIAIHAGQVLVYPRHTPPGVFVILAGVICRFAEGTAPEAGCGDLRDAARGAFATPAPKEVAEPAQAGLAAKTDLTLLFVPRSVVLARRDAESVLATNGISILPLNERTNPDLPAVTPRSER